MTKKFKSTARRSNKRLAGKTEPKKADDQLENAPPEGQSPWVQVRVKTETGLKPDATGKHEDDIKRNNPFAKPEMWKMKAKSITFQGAYRSGMSNSNKKTTLIMGILFLRNKLTLKLPI